MRLDEAKLREQCDKMRLGCRADGDPAREGWVEVLETTMVWVDWDQTARRTQDSGFLITQ